MPAASRTTAGVAENAAATSNRSAAATPAVLLDKHAVGAHVAIRRTAVRMSSVLLKVRNAEMIAALFANSAGVSHPRSYARRLRAVIPMAIVSRQVRCAMQSHVVLVATAYLTDLTAILADVPCAAVRSMLTEVFAIAQAVVPIAITPFFVKERVWAMVCVEPSLKARHAGGRIAWRVSEG